MIVEVVAESRVCTSKSTQPVQSIIEHNQLDDEISNLMTPANRTTTNNNRYRSDSADNVNSCEAEII